MIEVLEAAHPVPDQAGLSGASRIADIVRSARADDLAVVLMPGDASSLLVSPGSGVTFEDKRKVKQQLLRSGGPIGSMNLVRKSLSAIKEESRRNLSHQPRL